MKKRNESFLGMFFRVMGAVLRRAGQGPLGSGDLQLLAALFAQDRAQRLKLVMAEQFAEVDGGLDMFDGPEGSTHGHRAEQESPGGPARGELEQGQEAAGHLLRCRPPA